VTQGGVDEDGDPCPAGDFESRFYFQQVGLDWNGLSVEGRDGWFPIVVFEAVLQDENVVQGTIGFDYYDQNWGTSGFVSEPVLLTFTGVRCWAETHLC
jgi:hypothetical protein